PSGRLGAALARVGDLLDGLPPAPQVPPYASLREIAEAITRGSLGCALVTDPNAGANTVTGLITDGDLRRALLREPPRTGETAVLAQDIMTRDPLTLDAGQSAAAALALMEQRQISQLVITGRGEPEPGSAREHGPTILHLQRLLRAQVA
ncbi:MAG: CBS domain-containing protein, partial [Pseudomonadota bacterium]|nr:CBS domain-containing protein [Pseudomonadota bacterium]